MKENGFTIEHLPYLSIDRKAKEIEPMMGLNEYPVPDP